MVHKLYRSWYIRTIAGNVMEYVICRKRGINETSSQTQSTVNGISSVQLLPNKQVIKHFQNVLRCFRPIVAVILFQISLVQNCTRVIGIHESMEYRRQDLAPALPSNVVELRTQYNFYLLFQETLYRGSSHWTIATPRRLKQVAPAQANHYQCQRGFRLSSQSLLFVQEFL